MEDKKIFDDFPKVDCSDCSHYWDDSCNGVPQGSEKRCTAFLATKRVDIPVQIKSLRSALKWITGAFVVETFWVVCATIAIVVLCNG